MNMVMASSPELAKALAKHAGNPEAAPTEDKVLILGLYRGMFHIWSNAHRQHLNGTIDPVLYRSIVQELTAYAGETPAGELPTGDVVMTALPQSAQNHLRQFIEQIERLEEEKKAIAEDIRDKFAEAKAVGFDVKAMREILKHSFEVIQELYDKKQHVTGVASGFHDLDLISSTFIEGVSSM